MKFIFAIFVAALALTACTATTPRYYGGGGGGGVSYQTPNMDRLRDVDLGVGESLREDNTPNDDGQQGTNSGYDSSSPDEFGKPDKISG